MYTIYWLRNDFRLFDNTALIKAVEHARINQTKLIMLFHINTYQIKKSGFSFDYFFSALSVFYSQCKSLGIDIIVLNGELSESFKSFFSDVSPIDAVFFNVSERGYGSDRDHIIAHKMKLFGIKPMAYYSKHLVSAKALLTDKNLPYKVFTPYYNRWKLKPKLQAKDLDLNDLKSVLVDKKHHEVKLDKYIKNSNAKLNEALKKREYVLDNQCGQSAVNQELNEFVEHKLADYDKYRDMISYKGTSNISRFLSTGELSIRLLYEEILNAPESAGKNAYIRQLAWRDFYNMVHHYNRNQDYLELKPNCRQLEWLGLDSHFEDWKNGQTGYPLVDAAMRHFKKTGQMHNRLRMVVSSFLVKDLLLDWRWGERYFSEMLVDYDCASNIGGWQWAASVGTDAAPYFRVFNPITQSQRFDPDGTFIKSVLTELSFLDKKMIHFPYKYKDKIKSLYSLNIENIYPAPIVEHSIQRKLAIEMFKG